MAILLTAASVLIAAKSRLPHPILTACISNIAAGLFGTVITVVSLEAIRNAQIEHQQRKELLHRLRSKDVSTVATAIEDLKSKQLLNAGYLDGVDLRGVNFSNYDLRGMRAVGARFDGADFSNTMLYGSNLNYASLKDLKITKETNLLACKFVEVNLTGTDVELLRLIR